MIIILGISFRDQIEILQLLALENSAQMILFDRGQQLKPN